ncbi:MAG: Recombinase [Candidatus Uhrbacteria bacterium GW2011_GWD2_52_7]|uniref:Recombinase n=1 Tax=Candidatus Uhrbacteria bacterium GW2011_GWD2_52_7 TaxID=1618989 RepID=A0A0G2ABY8_9BACT|nr:MAG: Recombinase [Candidatus Uhrbacteria bacterium GW2011_GWD2_52_7]
MTENLPSPSERVAELVGRLQARFGTGNGESNEETAKAIRYVIYVRKSTDTAEKQERSIGDQTAECKMLADRLGLRWVHVIHEEQSAMTSDGRPKFREMLNELKHGDSYEGIIAWAPDRLARNMKEGGEIIDMLDHGDIQDIKFANNFVYNNDPSGKMLLGIAFIMAKQYSDQHSQNVTRANRHKTSEGKWAGSRLKHGYWKDKLHYLRPDGENHDLIKDVFRLRVEGKQLKEIAVYLQERGYPVQTAHTKHREMTIDDKFVSGILHDAIYVGAMKFGGQFENLLDKYDFVPAVSMDDYETLYKREGGTMGVDLAKVFAPRESTQAALMQKFAICGNCKKFMSTGITKNLYYLRCDTVGCKSKGKSTRAKVILAALLDFLKNHPLLTEEGYRRYTAEMAKVLAEGEKERDKDIRSLMAQKRHEDSRVEDMKELIRKDKGDKVLEREYKNDLKIHLAKAQELEKRIQKLKVKKEGAKDAIATYAEFHELFRNIADLIQEIDSMADLDFIIKKLFMNVTVTDQKVADITQNSPFRELCLDTDSVMVTSRGIEPRFNP